MLKTKRKSTSHKQKSPFDRLKRVLGPGLITGASDDDPSGIATYSQAGAQFGFSITWTLLFTYPMMTAIQEISGLIGRTTGKGIAANIRDHYPRILLYVIVFLLIVANTINIGADLSAMAEAVTLLIGGPKYFYLGFFAIACATIQVFVNYSRYSALLKWFTLALLAYFGTILFVKIPWGEAARGLFIPTFSSSKEFWTAVVAIFGTTISPYLFFWQASEEVEDIHDIAERRPLRDAPSQAADATDRIFKDTYVGMAFSNLVALAIMITTAATLHANGITDIQTSGQAAEALKPVAGEFAFAIFAIGIIGTGWLAVPVLAGSAGYAVCEALRRPFGLSLKPLRAKAFYGTIVVATMIGMAISFSPIDPIKALFWSAVVNGIIAVPIMIVMMRMSTNKSIMGKFCVGNYTYGVGWIATAAMFMACIAMIVTLF